MRGSGSMAKYLFYDEDGAKCEAVENWKTFTFFGGLFLLELAMIGVIWYLCHRWGWL